MIDTAAQLAQLTADANRQGAEQAWRAAHGIGRRVEPGRLDIVALAQGGGITDRARDGSACGMVTVRRQLPPEPRRTQRAWRYVRQEETS